MKQSGIYKRHTKIVCTIGPASDTAPIIERLIKAGMNIARLNLSHGSYDTHSKNIQIIRRVSRRLGIPVAVLIDLPGPKYRTGRLRDGRAVLHKGAQLTLTTGDIEGDAALVPVNLPGLAKDIKVGDEVLLDDGALQLKVLAKDADNIKCRVTVGGVLTDNRGLVVPGMDSSTPFVSDSLREQLLFAIKENVDYLAISFVSNAEDVSAVMSILSEKTAIFRLLPR